MSRASCTKLCPDFAPRRPPPAMRLVGASLRDLSNGPPYPGLAKCIPEWPGPIPTLRFEFDPSNSLMQYICKYTRTSLLDPRACIERCFLTPRWARKAACTTRIDSTPHELGSRNNEPTARHRYAVHRRSGSACRTVSAVSPTVERAPCSCEDDGCATPWIVARRYNSSRPCYRGLRQRVSQSLSLTT